MQPVPRIFVSATSRDLRTARGLVSEGLRRMECLPIVQDDFPPDYKSVRDMLRTKIATCDAVVHLAGFYYGAEPQPVLPGPDRRSFTQMEYEIAMEMKKPCYVFMCGKDFPFDKHDPEPEDKQQLQLDHRARLLQRDELFYEFATPEELSSRTRELQLSVENLREELAKERGRRRLTLIIAVAAIVIAVAGGGYLWNRQHQQTQVLAATNDKLEKQSALIDQLLAEQARIRRSGASNPQDIASEAEKNVAKTNNQSVEDIRRTLDEAIVEAQQAVEDARAGKGGMAATLRRVAEKSSTGKMDSGSNRDLVAALQYLSDAQLAAGHINEAIDAQIERLALIDRDKDPEVWVESTNTLVMAIWYRDVMSAMPLKTLREAVAWAKKNPDLGPENPATLALMSNLGKVITEPYEEKISIHRKVLDAIERKNGPQSPATIEAMIDLANSLSTSGNETKNSEQNDESEDIYRQIIKLQRKTLGDESPETLKTMANFAYTLNSHKKFAEAEELYREVIATREKTLGPDHQDVLNPTLLLAYVLEDQKDYPGAIELARRAYAGNERSLGPDSNETLISEKITAGLLERSKDPDNIEEAIKLYRHVLKTRIRTIGPGQPATLNSYENLAYILKKKGDTEEAKELTLRRLEEQGKVVGNDDTGYAFALFIAGSQFFTEDDPVAAEPLAERSYKIRKAKLGLDNEDTQKSLNLLIMTLNANRKTEEAEALKANLIKSKE